MKHALSYSRRYNTNSAVLIIELHDLDSLRDVYGQVTTDELMRSLARRLIKIKRESDTLGRFNSREFVLILENIADEDKAKAIKKRINQLMSEPIPVFGKELRLAGKTRIRALTDQRDLSSLVEYGFEEYANKAG